MSCDNNCGNCPSKAKKGIIVGGVHSGLVINRADFGDTVELYHPVVHNTLGQMETMELPFNNVEKYVLSSTVSSSGARMYVHESLKPFVRSAAGEDVIVKVLLDTLEKKHYESDQ